ncbi:MAG: aldehyde dehydrogenase family protein [Fimbriimonadaceae bacterium]|nr:aldehyde dehydrogenase family protein [Fimbriimonadaceae bacterium]
MSNVSDILNELDYGTAPEADKIAIEWLESKSRRFGHFIGGTWTSPEETFATSNPANGVELAQIAQGTEKDVSQAVETARAAYPQWSAMPGSHRARYLYAIARQIQKHSRLFAVLETMDNGKPIRETRDLDIPLVVRHFYHHAGWANLSDSEFDGYESVGVCGQIIPWNFPMLMLCWKIAPALAMGNTVVLKPAEFTSLTALLFAEICERIGLPAGVVNIVTGDGETGKALVAHSGVDKIAFTGSTEVGKHIRRATASTAKKLSLELGGKSPYIVFEDADLDSAVEGLVDAIWFNQGEVCCAGSRLLVQESIAEKLYAKIRARMINLRVGDPLDKATDIGAVVDETQLTRISGLVEQGVQEGAEIFQPKCEFPAGGCFYPPTLLTNVEPASTVAQVEIFGPVLVAMTFRTPSEAVTLANNTIYGLASSVWTQNLDTAHDIAAQIKAGTVWVNSTNLFDASVGFGGYRESGFGREGGREGLFEYLKPSLPSVEPEPLPQVTESAGSATGLDRTHKLYIGGKQARPDSGYSTVLPLVSGGSLEIARGNRKDVRNAVEAADSACASWAATTGFNRSQILYYLAENLEAARDVFIKSLADRAAKNPENEFNLSVERILWYAAWADKYEGGVHHPPVRAHVYTRPEPLGVAGVVSPAAPGLLGYLSVCLPLVAMGNAIVSVPSAHNPLPALELVRILEASDVPAGVWNLVTGSFDEVTVPLASHDGVAALWYFGEDDATPLIDSSAGNLKQTWCPGNLDFAVKPSTEFLRRATQVKNVWVPYGV